MTAVAKSTVLGMVVRAEQFVKWANAFVTEHQLKSITFTNTDKKLDFVWSETGQLDAATLSDGGPSFRRPPNQPRLLVFRECVGNHVWSVIFRDGLSAHQIDRIRIDGREQVVWNRFGMVICHVKTLRDGTCQVTYPTKEAKPESSSISEEGKS